MFQLFFHSDSRQAVLKKRRFTTNFARKFDNTTCRNIGNPGNGYAGEKVYVFEIKKDDQIGYIYGYMEAARAMPTELLP